MDTKEKNVIKGGEFLVKETAAKDVFIPGDFDEEQKMIWQTCVDFLEKEVRPNLDRIDNQEKGLMETLLKKAGDLGLMAVSIPDEYGGYALNFVTSLLSIEGLGAGHSFSVAFTAHNGIGTLPILYYGTKEQKEKYIPKLATGEWKGAYCLTEPDAGSDANAGKTKATLSNDKKHYLLNGQKVWITNGGFANILTVFAKIDDDKTLSAFILERNYEGISFSPEEKKMGIKGSSTRQIFLDNCKVPVENLLGNREDGFKIALNILNIGRIKLAAATTGASKEVISNAVRYSNERVQFKHPISSFGAIKYKLAEQVIRTYATEAALYRCGQNIDDAISALEATGMEKGEATLEGIKQFATEAAIMKVFGSDSLDYVVDEGVQIYGGMGYSSEAPMDRAYRDSRINRIFEGTNEINRMLIIDMLLKKSMKGEIDLMGPAKSIVNELMSIPDFGSFDECVFGEYRNYVKNFKKAVLLVAGAAVQKLMLKIADEQEILIDLANMVIQTYISESILLRVEKLTGKNGEAACLHQIGMMKVFITDAADRINQSGKNAISSFASGDELRILQLGIKRFTKINLINTKDIRRGIADQMIEKNEYCF